MWEEAMQTRLDALRGKDELGALSVEERRELDLLYAELDAEETARLGQVRAADLRVILRRGQETHLALRAGQLDD